MLARLATGQDEVRLVNALGDDTGWIRAHVIGFRGFTSEHAARAAAVEGARALEACLRREFGVRHPALAPTTLLPGAHDDAAEWIADGRVRIARLIRPERGQLASLSYAIEFVLPAFATETIAMNAARLIYDTLSPWLSRAPNGRHGTVPLQR